MSYRINRKNKSLFDLPASHPAARALMVHAQCRNKCVGRETPWPGKEEEAFDQEWYSQSEACTFTFSRFAYQFISYDLVLDGWIAHPAELTPMERGTLEMLPRLRVLMVECETAAQADKNARVLECIEIVRKWMDALESCIARRIDDDEIRLR